MYINKTFTFRVFGFFVVEIHSEQRDKEGISFKHFCYVYFGFKHSKTRMFGFHWRTGPNNIDLGYGTTRFFQKNPEFVGERQIIYLE